MSTRQTPSQQDSDPGEGARLRERARRKLDARKRSPEWIGKLRDKLRRLRKEDPDIYPLF